jgi:hypothetical protein
LGRHLARQARFLPRLLMSDLDLPAALARLDRDRAETSKLLAESRKLLAEEHKFNREPWLMLSVALAALVGTLLGSVPALLTILLRTP